MINQEDHIISKGVMDACKILTTQNIKFRENRIEAERRMKELQKNGFHEEYGNLESLRNDYAIFESGFRSNASEHLRLMPIWKYFLSKVTDLDPISALALIIGIEDISRFEYPSKLWGYCGMQPYMIDVNSRKRWFQNKELAIDFVSSMCRKNHSHAETGFKARENEIDQLLESCVYGDGYSPKKVIANEGDNILENCNKFLKNICSIISEDFDGGTGNGFYHQQLRQAEIIEIHKLSKGNHQNITDKLLTEPNAHKELIRHLPKNLVIKANSRARREITRLFLGHLVQYWRQLRDLPNKKPQLRKGCEVIEFPGMSLVFTAL